MGLLNAFRVILPVQLQICRGMHRSIHRRNARHLAHLLARHQQWQVSGQQQTGLCTRVLQYGRTAEQRWHSQ